MGREGDFLPPCFRVGGQKQVTPRRRTRNGRSTRTWKQTSTTTDDDDERRRMKTYARGLLALALIAGLVSMATAQTRRLQQGYLANGITSPQTLYIPGLGLSISIGNVPGFYTEGILDGLFDGGPLDGLSSYMDYGLGGLIEQSVNNGIALASDAAVGSSTIVAGK